MGKNAGKNSTRLVLKAFPVLVACEGCPAYGQAAHRVGTVLDRRGALEVAWLGEARNLATIRAKAKSRYPVYALDACDKGCAAAWLRDQGVRLQRAFVLKPEDAALPEAAADRLQSEL
jgi:uncharacterized metal-binding protein